LIAAGRYVYNQLEEDVRWVQRRGGSARLMRFLRPREWRTMSTDETGSITRWLSALKAGRAEAVEAIWRRYYERVLAVARLRLRQGPHQAVEDSEDVALSAIHGFAGAAARGQLDRLDDRSDLWQILAAITVKKALQRRRWYHRWKRTGRPAAAERPTAGQRERHEKVLDQEGLLARAISKEPAPEVALVLREQIERLLSSLPDPTLRQIAEWRMQGATNAEIAGRLGRAVRTIERKIELIRLVWEKTGEWP
jgi:DNA-directed RNA polymerase specialized sigma24 family protein